jgi:hypothetical protein
MYDILRSTLPLFGVSIHSSLAGLSTIKSQYYIRKTLHPLFRDQELESAVPHSDDRSSLVSALQEEL